MPILSDIRLLSVGETGSIFSLGGLLNPDSAVGLTVLFERGVRLQERWHRAAEFHRLVFGAWQSVAAKSPTARIAPLLSNCLEAEAYGLRYGGLGHCSMRQLLMRNPASRNFSTKTLYRWSDWNCYSMDP